MTSKEKTVAELMAAIADDERPILPWTILIAATTTLAVSFFALATAGDENLPLNEWPPSVIGYLIGRELVLSVLIATLVWLPFSLFAFAKRSVGKKMMALGIAVVASLIGSVWMRYAVYQHNIPVDYHNGVVQRVNTLQSQLDADFNRLTFVPIFGGGTTPENIDERVRTTHTAVTLLTKFQQDMASEEGRDRRELAELSISAADRSALSREIDATFASGSERMRRSTLTLAMFQKAEDLLTLLKAHRGEWRVVNGQIQIGPGPTFDQAARAISDYQAAAAALRPYGQPNAAPATQN